MSETKLILSLGDYKKSVDNALAQLNKEKVIERIWNKDHTVWSDSPAEITNRLGWLDSPAVTLKSLDEINAFVESVKADGYTNALLLGMGGSSLAPEVFRFTFGVQKGYLDLFVLDSTDPGAVLEYARKFDPAKTLFIVSTKSGGTVETFSYMKYFFNETTKKTGLENAGRHFTAITDPGSGLEKVAQELKFRKIFLNDPNIGGRYSALSFFGIVPAALVGVDIKKLILRTSETVSESKSSESLGAVLGTLIGEFANLGKDKITFIMSKEISYLGSWVEQLIAESTGKNGKGVLPVDGESILSPEFYGKDRLFIVIRLSGDNAHEKDIKTFKDAGYPVIEIIIDDLYDLGSQFFIWEIATVVAGWRIGIQPFDQPNVESAKVLARQMLKDFQSKGKLPELIPSFKEKDITVYGDINSKSMGQALKEFLSLHDEGDKEGNGRSYVSIQAYLKPGDKTTAALQSFRTVIQKKYRLAVTVGYGPRFLHSTGQLHKGDAGKGLFIQFTADMPEDIPIPDNPGEDKSSVTFGILKNSQALGDRQALLDGGRKVIRFDLGKNIIEGLNNLKKEI
jgi:glucose-6-phosphate isomerase